MDVNITQVNPTTIKAEVTLAWEKVADSYQDSLHELQKQAQLPGFRKGKVPVALLKRRFRKMLTDEIARKVVPDDVTAWIKEKDVKAVGQPHLDHIGLHENESFHYAVYLDVLPEFDLQPWEGLEVESLIVEVQPEMVDQEIERRLAEATKREEITDRAVEAGDTVTLALNAIDKEAGEELTNLEEYVLKLGAEDAHPHLAELVIGMEPGIDASDEYAAPDDDAFEEWRGKTVTTYVEILKIERIEIPALDDTFAKEQGAEDIDDFRKKVQSEMTEHLMEREGAQTRGRLVTQMAHGYDFEVPSTLITEEAKKSVEQQIMPYAQYLGKKGMDQKLMEMMMQAAWPQATLKVRADLILDKVAESLDLQIEDSELDQELEQILDMIEADSVQELRENEAHGNLLEAVKTMIRRRKTVDAIYEKAEVKKVDTLTEEKEEPEAVEETDRDPEAPDDPAAATPESQAANDATEQKEKEEDTAPAG